MRERGDTSKSSFRMKAVCLLACFLCCFYIHIVASLQSSTNLQNHALVGAFAYFHRFYKYRSHERTVILLPPLFRSVRPMRRTRNEDASKLGNDGGGGQRSSERKEKSLCKQRRPQCIPDMVTPLGVEKVSR